MNTNRIIIWGIFLLIVIIYLIFYYKDVGNKLDNTTVVLKEVVKSSVNETKKEQKFLSSSLKTNTSKSSIDLSQVLSWWPWKNGIPAINKTKFLSIEEAEEKMEYLSLESRWISIKTDTSAKFYPYEILYWHEIVNDTVWNKDLAITFCPLCWSAIVFDRVVNWETLDFWVSGKLYESNLLMFDTKTESLWSQSLWEAVVWDMLWTTLKHEKFNLMTLWEFKENFSNWEILSDDTWYNRSYGSIPYKWYETDENLYFPVSNLDSRFSKKEMFYIVNNPFKNESVAFLFSDLRKVSQWELEVSGDIYKVNFDKWIITSTINWKEIPWYYEMWFSWINNNKGNLNIWKE